MLLLKTIVTLLIAIFLFSSFSYTFSGTSGVVIPTRNSTYLNIADTVDSLGNYYQFDLNTLISSGNWLDQVIPYGGNYYLVGSNFYQFNGTTHSIKKLLSPQGYFSGAAVGNNSLYLYGNYDVPSGGGLMLFRYYFRNESATDMSSIFPQNYENTGSGDTLVSGSYGNGTLALVEASFEKTSSALMIIDNGSITTIPDPSGYTGTFPVFLSHGNGYFLFLYSNGGVTYGGLVNAAGTYKNISSYLNANNNPVNIIGDYYYNNGVVWNGTDFLITGSAGIYALDPLTLSVQVFPYNLSPVFISDFGHDSIVGGYNGVNLVLSVLNTSKATFSSLYTVSNATGILDAQIYAGNITLDGIDSGKGNYPELVYVTKDIGWVSGTINPVDSNISVSGSVSNNITNGIYNSTAMAGLDTITAISSGYLEFTGNVSVSYMQTTDYNVSLVKGHYGNISIKINPSSYLQINGQLYGSNVSVAHLNNTLYGNYDITAINPYYQWYDTIINLSMSDLNITINLTRNSGVTGNYYPWVPIGPYDYPNPASFPKGNTFSPIVQRASGHIGPIAINFQDPNEIFAASGTGPAYSGPLGDGGIFKTVDGGSYWQSVDYGLPYARTSSLIMDQFNTSVLIAGMDQAGIYRTIDSGGYWYKVSNFSFVTDLVYQNGTIFASSSEGVIDSVNFGETWGLLYPTASGVETLNVSGNYIYGVLANHQLIRSDNSGKSWNTVYDFSNISYDTWSVKASPFNPLDVYVFLGIFQGVASNVWFSSNGGLSFGPIFDMNYSKMIIFDPNNQSRDWVIGPGYVAFSTDGGATFNAAGQVTDNMNLVIDSKSANIMVIGSDQGIYASYNYGKTWSSINGNLNDSLVYGVGVSSNGSLIIADMQDYSAFISHNSGKTWIGGNEQPIPIGGEGTFVYVNPYNSSWVYGVGIAGSLMISDNGATSFQSLNSILGPPTSYNWVNGEEFYADQYNHSRIFFGTGNGIYNGTVYGKNWAFWNGSPADVTSFFAYNNGSSYIAGTMNGIYTYSGGTWKLSSGISGNIDSVAINPSNSSIILASVGQYEYGGIYISYDYGNHFQLLESNLAGFIGSYNGYNSIDVQLLFLNISGYPLIAVTPNGIYLSTNTGQNWNSISYNLLSGQVTYAVFVNDTLYISTYGQGILKYANFSLETLPGTLNGFVRGSGVQEIEINGTNIPVLDGHFTARLKPGVYTVREIPVEDGYTSEYNVTVYPMSVINLTFNNPTYLVTFIESGLPSGTSWSVTFNGTTQTSTTGTITFSVPNGSYSYTVGSVMGYNSSPSSGSISVSGSSINQAITFTAIKKTISNYTVTFTESGLPSGTAWYVNLSNGMKSGAITSSTYSFSLANGSVSYTISGTSGYSANSTAGSFTVNGHNLSISVKFTKPSTPASSITAIEEYSIVGAVVAIALIGLFIWKRRSP